MRVVAAAAGLILLACTGWAAFAPVAAGSREQVFEIPAGTHARRMGGNQVEILPRTIELTLGVKDILVFRNSDTAPHIFGPTLIMPGQSFRLPFAAASTYSFQCTAHADGQLSVIVEPAPAPGWRRLRWRWRNMFER